MRRRGCWLVCIALSACSGSSEDGYDEGPQPDASLADSGNQSMGDARVPTPDAGEHDADMPGTDASTETDSGAPMLCTADGATCSAEAGGQGICCGGSCVVGECCGASGCGEGFLCGADHRCLDVAGSLAGLAWELPCTGSKNTEACANGPDVNVAATLGGAPGTVYDVRLRFRGVVEAKTYLDGCSTADDTWQVGGTPASDTGNIYRLDISSPAQTYYLNRGTSGDPALLALDFEETVRVAAGATVTLYAASIDGAELLNIGGPNAPVSVGGVSLAQPYDGQFIEMDVVSVSPDAVQPQSQGTASTALALHGGQFASVSDAESLRPSDVTLEAWFLFSGVSPGSYASLVSKPYQTGTDDSYTIWFQSDALYAGANLASTSGAPTLPWSADAQTWHHVTLTFESALSRARIYVDGVLRSCAQATSPIAYDAHPLYIGADTDNESLNGLLKGAIDEVRVFSSVRTAEQVWADMHSATPSAASTLVGAWNFEEGAGQTAADASGQGNHAVLGTNDTAETSDPQWIQVTLPR
ncbi:MAG: LamG domain-containing protein [Myxococcales bacterium]